MVAVCEELKGVRGEFDAEFGGVRVDGWLDGVRGREESTF